MKRTAFIIARKNSKRIPNKNTKLFFGKPMISYSIEKCLKSNLFDEVIISSDCNKVEEISSSYENVSFYRRPADLSDDFTDSIEVYKFCVNNIANLENSDQIWIIAACAPLLNINSLIKASKYRNFSLPLVSCSKCDCNEESIYLEKQTKKDRILKRKIPSAIKMRSQDFKSLYKATGVFSIFTPEYIKETPRNKFTLFIKPLFLNFIESIDINTEEDWNLSEQLFKSLESK